MFFRAVVLFFTVATLILSVWAVIGSYKNESYLTDNYLLSFQLSNLNLSTIFEDALTKRDFALDLQPVQLPFEPLPLQPVSVQSLVVPLQTDILQSQITSAPATPTEREEQEKRDLLSAIGSLTSLVNGAVDNSAVASLLSANSITNIASAVATADLSSALAELADIATGVSIPDSIATLAAAYAGDIDSLIEEIVDEANVTDLGLADMYSVGFWGYCRGSLSGLQDEWVEQLGLFGKQFSNKNVNWTYCSLPEVGYRFDPLTLMKHEILALLSDKFAALSSTTAGLSDALSAKLLALVADLTYDDLGLPGDLQNKLTLLQNLTVAAFALILAGAVLAFISLVFQLVGFCCSPDNMCLSCLNFMFMLFTFIVVLVGSALSTGAYIYVRRVVNDEVELYGVRSYLSVQYYAFSWSAVAASLLLVVFAFLGYCCGCFHSGQRRYRPVEPAMRYDHKY